MGIRTGLLRRLVQSTGYTIVGTDELRRLRAQCGTLRAEKDRIQTRANQYHDQASKLTAHKYSLIQKVGDASMRALKAEDSAANATCPKRSIDESTAETSAALSRSVSCVTTACFATRARRSVAAALSSARAWWRG